MFISLDDKCKCSKRIKDKRQYPHDILLHGDYKKYLDLQRHMAWECITGSFAGCEKDYSLSIYTIIGYEPEVMDASKYFSLYQQGSPNDDVFSKLEK